MSSKRRHNEENEPGTDATEGPDLAPLPDDFAGLDLPADFKPLGLSGPQAWVVKGKGVRVRGMVLSRFAKRGKSAKKGFGYQIRLTGAPVICSLNKEQVTIERGGVVCVDESKAVEELAKLSDGVDRGGEYEVIIDYGAERDLEDGNSFWPARVVFKTVKQPTGTATGAAARGDALNGAKPADESNIPFG